MILKGYMSIIIFFEFLSHWHLEGIHLVPNYNNRIFFNYYLHLVE